MFLQQFVQQKARKTSWLILALLKRYQNLHLWWIRQWLGRIGIFWIIFIFGTSHSRSCYWNFCHSHR